MDLYLTTHPRFVSIALWLLLTPHVNAANTISSITRASLAQLRIPNRTAVSALSSSSSTKPASPAGLPTKQFARVALAVSSMALPANSVLMLSTVCNAPFVLPSIGLVLSASTAVASQQLLLAPSAPIMGLSTANASSAVKHSPLCSAATVLPLPFSQAIALLAQVSAVQQHAHSALSLPSSMVPAFPAQT